MAFNQIIQVNYFKVIPFEITKYILSFLIKNFNYLKPDDITKIFEVCKLFKKSVITN